MLHFDNKFQKVRISPLRGQLTKDQRHKTGANLLTALCNVFLVCLSELNLLSIKYGQGTTTLKVGTILLQVT